MWRPKTKALLLLHLAMLVSSQSRSPGQLDLRGQPRFSQQNFQRLQQLQLIKNRILEGLNLESVPSLTVEKSQARVKEVLSQFKASTDARRRQRQQENMVILFSEPSVIDDERDTEGLVSFRLRTNSSAGIQSANLFLRLRRHPRNKDVPKTSDDPAPKLRQMRRQRRARAGEKRFRKRRRRRRGKKVKVVVHRINDVTLRKRRLAVQRVRISKAKWLNIRLDPDGISSYIAGNGRTLLLKLSCKRCQDSVDLDLVHKRRRSRRKRGRRTSRMKKLNKYRPFLVLKSQKSTISSPSSSPTAAAAKETRSTKTKRLTRSSAERWRPRSRNAVRKSRTSPVLWPPVQTPHRGSDPSQAAFNREEKGRFAPMRSRLLPHLPRFKSRSVPLTPTPRTSFPFLRKASPLSSPDSSLSTPHRKNDTFSTRQSNYPPQAALSHGPSRDLTTPSLSASVSSNNSPMRTTYNEEFLRTTSLQKNVEKSKWWKLFTYLSPSPSTHDVPSGIGEKTNVSLLKRSETETISDASLPLSGTPSMSSVRSSKSAVLSTSTTPSIARPSPSASSSSSSVDVSQLEKAASDLNLTSSSSSLSQTPFDKKRQNEELLYLPSVLSPLRERLAPSFDGRGREKRQAENCQSDNTRHRCCQRNIYVSFEEIGWGEWIISPAGFHTALCYGSCGERTSDFPPANKWRRISVLAGNGCRAVEKASLTVTYYRRPHWVITQSVPGVIDVQCGCPSPKTPTTLKTLSSEVNGFE